ncbi:MAG TPA: hypothetical protein VHB79_12350 [Polyangiaceae bacterium]|nr:hypothetical protein [Polyangiaceae bacterium]
MAAPLVVVVTSNPDAPFVRRLAAELALFGYRVELQPRAGMDGDLLELLARSGGAALIAVDQGSQTAEVVVGESAVSGPARRERERLDPRRRADTNAAVLAERFRARLTELGIAPSASPEEAPLPPPPPPPPRPAPEPERRLWLAAALGVASGGLGAVPEAALELRAFPARFVSTSAFGKWSLSPANVRSDVGSADVRLVSGGVLIDAYPWRARDFALKAGLGALLVNASMSGHAADSAGKGREVSVLVAAGMFETGVTLRVAPRVAAEVSGFVGACSPRVGVHFEGQPVADYGQPFFGGSLGVAIGVF